MILAICFSAPATAQQVTGAEKVSFAGLFAWWLPARAAGPRPAVIALHGCSGLYGRSGGLGERHRAMAELLRSRGFHVLFPDSFTPRGLRQICTVAMSERPLRSADRRLDIQGAVDWLAARPEVDRGGIVLLGWSHGGGAVLAALNRKVQVRAAVAFYPGCSVYARSKAGYAPSAPLLILIGALDDWTPPGACVELGKRSAKVTVRVLPDAYHDFDHPSAPVRVRKDVPNGVRPGEGVTVGSNPAARRQAYAEMLEFIERELRH